MTVVVGAETLATSSQPLSPVVPEAKKIKKKIKGWPGALKKKKKKTTIATATVTETKNATATKDVVAAPTASKNISKITAVVSTCTFASQNNKVKASGYGRLRPTSQTTTALAAPPARKQQPPPRPPSTTGTTRTTGATGATGETGTSRQSRKPMASGYGKLAASVATGYGKLKTRGRDLNGSGNNNSRQTKRRKY